jgi:hypothetical protein
MQKKHLELIRAMIKRPGMFGIYNAEDMHLVLFGAMMFCPPQSYRALSDFQHGFRLFVNKHFGFKKDQQWHRLIKFYCGDNGFHEIKIFGQLFESYLVTLGK